MTNQIFFISIFIFLAQISYAESPQIIQTTVDGKPHEIQIEQVPFSYGNEQQDLTHQVGQIGRTLDGLNNLSLLKGPQGVCPNCTPKPPMQTNPFTLFGLNIPLNTQTQPERALRLSLQTGNTMINPTVLKCQTGNCTRTYDIDFVGDTFGVNYSQPLKGNKNQEFGVSLNILLLQKGNEYWNPLHLVTSDSAIEAYHSANGDQDPFGRRLKGFNQVTGSMTDRKGHKISFSPDQAIPLPLELRFTQYAPIHESEENQVTANAGLHAGIPLQPDFNASFSVGISSGIQATHKLGDKWSITGATGGSVTNQDVVSVNRNAYEPYDKPFQWAYTFLIAANREDKDKSGNTGFFFSTRSESAAFDASNYGPVDFHYDQPKVQDRFVRARNAGIDNTHYMSVGVVRVIRSKDGNRTHIQFSCNEDFEPARILSRGQLGGNNGEDFGCGIGVQRSF